MNNSWILRYINEKPFLLKYEFLKESYRIYLSDMSAVYEENIQGPHILQKHMELNPNIEMEQDRLMDIIKSCLESTLLQVSKMSKDELILESSSVVGGIKFIWHFCSRLCEPIAMRNFLVSPLLGMIFELLKRQSELIACIEKKDAEIEDYKNNGAKVSRAYLETKKFEEQDFLSTKEMIKIDEQEVLKTVFNGSGKTLLKAITEGATSDLSHSKPEKENEKNDADIGKEDVYDDMCSQMELENKRRQDIENISSKPKVKKKKTFKL